MTRHKFKHLWIEQYGINLYWVVCDLERYRWLINHEFGEKVPNKGEDERSYGKFVVYTKRGQQIAVIWLRKGKAKAGELAHEAFHAAHWILQSKGLWLTDSSEEAYAYLIQFIVKSIKC